MSWADQETEEESKSSIRDIHKIVMESHWIGALEGAGFGLVGGLGLGALIGQVIVCNEGEWGTGGGAAVGLILGGGMGIIAGPIIGAIIGRSYNYEYLTIGQSDFLQNEK